MTLDFFPIFASYLLSPFLSGQKCGHTNTVEGFDPLITIKCWLDKVLLSLLFSFVCLPDSLEDRSPSVLLFQYLF